jgi:hypothetical protein
MADTKDKVFEKLEKVLNAIGRDAQRLDDYELADGIGRSVEFAKELLLDLRLEPEAVEALAA